MRFWTIGILAAALVVAGCDSGTSGDAGGTAGATGPLKSLIKVDTVPGKGPGAKEDDTLLVEYTGSLANGTVFDSNKDHNGGAPFTVQLGHGGVIKGWYEGLMGMKEGATRKLSIPSDLAYGAQGSGSKIPPNTDLYFQITLDKLIPAEDVDNPVITNLKKGSGPKAKKGDTVTIKYVCKYGNGIVKDPGVNPLDVTIGSHGAIQGVEYALIDRQVGDSFNLQVPPRWAYGTGGPNSDSSWYFFDIKVLKIVPGKPGAAAESTAPQQLTRTKMQ